jgi:hypothetical protein
MLEHGVSAPQLNAQLTQNFFNQVINNLRTRAEDTREMTQDLADQQLTQESMSAYVDFINTLFSERQPRADTAKQAEQRGR